MNENQKISRNRKRRIERKIKLNGIMKSLLKKFQSQKKQKMKIFIKLKN